MAVSSDEKRENVVEHREEINSPSSSDKDEVIGFVAELDELPKGIVIHLNQKHARLTQCRLLPIQILPRLDLRNWNGPLGSDGAIRIRCAYTGCDQ